MVGRMNEPIACTLTPYDAARRVEQLATLGGRALRDREPIAGGERLTFDADEATERELRAAIEAESRCCAFLEMRLRRAPDALVLEVTGPEPAQPIIQQLFAPAPL